MFLLLFSRNGIILTSVNELRAISGHFKAISEHFGHKWRLQIWRTPDRSVREIEARFFIQHHGWAHLPAAYDETAEFAGWEFYSNFASE